MLALHRTLVGRALLQALPVGSHRRREALGEAQMLGKEQGVAD
jgi:hypothetical protein